MALSKLGDVELLVEEETFTYDSDVTENSMEDGSYMSDNMHIKPIEGKLTGIVCNNDGSYPSEKQALLRSYHDDTSIVDYYGTRALQNCVLQNLEIVHNAQNGGGFTFTITIKQLFIATKSYINIEVTSLNIPDIEALKDQLQADETAQKAAAKKAANAKVNGMVTKGRTAKKKATATPKPKKGKASKNVLQDIIDMYG